MRIGVISLVSNENESKISFVRNENQKSVRNEYQSSTLVRNENVSNIDIIGEKYDITLVRNEKASNATSTITNQNNRSVTSKKNDTNSSIYIHHNMIL